MTAVTWILFGIMVTPMIYSTIEMIVTDVREIRDMDYH